MEEAVAVETNKLLKNQTTQQFKTECLLKISFYKQNQPEIIQRWGMKDTVSSKKLVSRGNMRNIKDELIFSGISGLVKLNQKFSRLSIGMNTVLGSG